MAKKKGKGKWIAAALAVVTLAGIGFVYIKNKEETAQADPAAAVRTANVIRGSISSIVSGSGSVATSREQELAAPGASSLLEIHVEDGDYVSAGDTLFVLDCPEVVSSQQAVSKYEYQLTEFYAARDELRRQADKDYLVTAVNAKVGDNLAKNGALLSLLDISSMSLQVSAEDGAGWTAGQSVQISLLEYGNTVTGTLSGTPSASSSNGMDYLSFTLLLDKGQRIAGETYGQAYNQALSNQAAVMLKPNTETLIKSPAEGSLEELNAVEGEIIKAGTLMYRISSTNLDSQISDANSEMQVAMANLKQKQTTLTADFDGIYYAASDSSGPKNTFLQVGDNLTNAESLGKVVDAERMQIVFNVDELDIAKVEIGQEVKVVADALPDEVYTGRVARIAQEGSSSGNVAYYWVLIEVTEWDGLKVGMTSSLEIVVEDSENTLMVPINAVQTLRGTTYVVLAADQSSAGTGTAAVRPGTGGAANDASGAGQAEENARLSGAVQGGQSGRNAAGQNTPAQDGQYARGIPAAQTPLAAADAPDAAGVPESPAQGGTGTGTGPGANADTDADVSSGTDADSGTDAGPGADADAGAQDGGATVPALPLPLPERAVIVETGIINDTYVEILSGLEEGQLVELSGTSATNTGDSQNFMMMGPGGGMAGGGQVMVTSGGGSGGSRGIGG